jgi:hypothetical protein
MNREQTEFVIFLPQKGQQIHTYRNSEIAQKTSRHVIFKGTVSRDFQSLGFFYHLNIRPGPLIKGLQRFFKHKFEFAKLTF